MNNKNIINKEYNYIYEKTLSYLLENNIHINYEKKESGLILAETTIKDIDYNYNPQINQYFDCGDPLGK